MLLITKINPEIKQRIMHLYMARQNLLHTVRFLKWLQVNRADKCVGKE